MEILKSPIFTISVFLFAVHQFLQKYLEIPVPYIDLYLDNLLAMPIILTLLLAERRFLFKKGKHYRLPLLDVVVATAYIAFITEVIFPLLSEEFTTDWWDLLFYAIGSIVFYLTVNRLSKEKQGEGSE